MRTVWKPTRRRCPLQAGAQCALFIGLALGAGPRITWAQATEASDATAVAGQDHAAEPGAHDGHDHAAAAAPQPDTATTEVSVDEKWPIAEVAQPRHDFGTVWTNDDLRHEFIIRNTGDAPLKIVRVKPACGCTVAGSYPNEIPPGGSGALPFQLNAKKLIGKFTKSIAVTTNDPKTTQLQFILAGEVKQYVEMEPRIVQFGRVKPDSVITSKVVLTNNTDQKLELSLPEDPLMQCFSATLNELEPGKRFELNVTAKPPFAAGINRVNIPLKTNIENQPTLDVTCIATLPKRIELRPDKIQITGRARTESVRKVLLTNNGDQPLTIRKVESTDSRLGADYTEIEAGSKYQLSVTIPADYSMPPANTAIVIHTSDDKEAEIRLPVVGRALPRAQRQEPPAKSLVGQPAPEAKTVTYGGDEITVGGKQDKVQFLTFYASWCGFCKKALPEIQKLKEKYEDNPDVEFVAINLDDRVGRRGRSESETIRHYEEMGLTMPMILDSDKEIGVPYKVESFPTMVLVGKSGTVESVQVGAPKGFDMALVNQIDTLAAGKTRADFRPVVTTGPVVRPAALHPVPSTTGGEATVAAGAPAEKDSATEDHSTQSPTVPE